MNPNLRSTINSVVEFAMLGLGLAFGAFLMYAAVAVMS